jgi:hypothetical protein
MKKIYTIYLSIILLVSVALGTVMGSRGKPLNYAGLPHFRLAEIKLLEVAPEKITFRLGAWDFYLEGNSPSMGSTSNQSLLFQDTDGTYCVLSVSDGMQDGMETFTDQAANCFREAHDADDDVGRRWQQLSETDLIYITPAWSSQ